MVVEGVQNLLELELVQPLTVYSVLTCSLYYSKHILSNRKIFFTFWRSFVFTHSSAAKQPHVFSSVMFPSICQIFLGHIINFFNRKLGFYRCILHNILTIHLESRSHVYRDCRYNFTNSFFRLFSSPSINISNVIIFFHLYIILTLSFVQYYQNQKGYPSFYPC